MSKLRVYRSPMRWGWLSLAALVLAAVAGCGGSGSASLQTVEVSPANSTAAAGTSLQLNATAIYSDGHSEDVTAGVSWSSSNSAIASVSSAGGSAGTLSALTPGTTSISATMQGIQGKASVTVTPATLVSLELTPATPSLAKGLSLALTATGVFSDHTTQNLSSQVTWSSSSAAVASISNATGSGGVVTGLAVGSATITATSGSVAANINLNVTAAVLTEIQVSPPHPTLASGMTLSLTATGIFSDHTTQNLTTQVSWSTSNGAVATVSTSVGSQGKVTGGAPGQVTISAALGAVSGNTAVTVSAAALVSIAITPSNPSIANGLSQQFVATGTFTDHSTQNLTTQVTWSSSHTNVAAISNASNSQGLASTLAPGTTSIAAQLGTINSQPVTLTVTAATLVSVQVTPSSASIPLGTTQPFTATGTYTDNSTQNLTSVVTWQSDNPAVASVSNAAPSNGLASTTAVGVADISATFGAVNSAPIPLTVTSAALVSIQVTPIAPIIANGLTEAFTATGSYTDNSTQNLTATVTWTTGNAAVATISNVSGFAGIASSQGVGSTTITATSGQISGSTNLSVTSAALVSIGVTPQNPSVALGTAQAFTATGTYTDGSTQPLTTTVTWSSASPAVASISNASGSQGQATSIGTGVTSISATLNSVTGSASLTVTAATLVSIAVTPSSASILVGATQQFTATGTYTDNSTQDLTGTATWNSDTGSVASISNASGSNGLATAIAIGTANISAVAGGITSTAATLSVDSATTQETVLHSFAMTATDGAGPWGGLLQANDGNFYGMSSAGGASGFGTIFEYSPSTQTFAVIHSFVGGAADGAQPQGSLIQASDGNLYGLTQYGGASNNGVIFQFNLGTQAFTLLYSFEGGPADGANPLNSLTQASDGNFYGMTLQGGASGIGTFFVYNPTTQAVTVLHSFAGGTSDGKWPYGNFLQANDGNLYGMTLSGGADNQGTVFEYSLTAQAFTLLHSFAGGSSDGLQPVGSLMQASDGNLYGMTSAGGANNLGTIFEYGLATQTVTVLHSLAQSDGAYPWGNLIQANDGNFYGLTQQGGASNDGTIFEYDPTTHAFLVLHSFAGGPSDGQDCIGSLIQANDGNFYGMTLEGGANSSAGTMFELQ
jgi:uncharacterized repeat protein (TIGR03803 family)